MDCCRVSQGTVLIPMHLIDLKTPEASVSLMLQHSGMIQITVVAFW